MKLKNKMIGIIGATLMASSMMSSKGYAYSNLLQGTENNQIIRAESQPLSLYQVIKKSDVKIVKMYKSPQIKSNIFELNNGATVVINHKEGVYELFVEELQDWSVPCATYGDLLEYLELYIEHKYDYMYYDNIDVEYDQECCSIITTNGIEIITSEDVEGNDVYLPIFGNELPYPCKDMEQAKKVCTTYYESLNYMNY